MDIEIFFGRIADGADEVLKAVCDQIHAEFGVFKLIANVNIITTKIKLEGTLYIDE